MSNIFKCNKCGLEMDFDEDKTEIIECWDNCGGVMIFERESGNHANERK